MVNLLLTLVLSFSIICMIPAFYPVDTIRFYKKQEILENRISIVAPNYIGIPYKFGGDPEKAGMADNSHLLCKIYDEAARQAGMKFAGYMEMKRLLRNTVKIRRNQLRNGDLMVLKDGHAAMIYKVDGRDNFFLIYASLRRQEVISFSSKNLVFEAYWLKNLKGFYRLKENMFMPVD